MEKEIRLLGCPVDDIKAAHPTLSLEQDASGRISSEDQWLCKGSARAHVVGWLLRRIETSLVDVYAPRSDTGEEDIDGLVRVAEMMGLSPPGHGSALVMGSSTRGGPETWGLFENTVAMAKESSKMRYNMEQVRKAEQSLMEDIAKMASGSGGKDTASSRDSILFSNGITGILPQLPSSVSVPKEAGQARGKQWLKGLEEELGRVEKNRDSVLDEVEAERCMPS
jgi:hypothetical protein